MKVRLSLLTAALAAAAWAQTAVPSAEDMVNAARAQAGKRSVWVIFHASW